MSELSFEALRRRYDEPFDVPRFGPVRFYVWRIDGKVVTRGQMLRKAKAAGMSKQRLTQLRRIPLKMLIGPSGLPQDEERRRNHKH